MFAKPTQSSEVVARTIIFSSGWWLFREVCSGQLEPTLVFGCRDTISAHIEATAMGRVPIVADFPSVMIKCCIGRLRIGAKAPDTVKIGRTGPVIKVPKSEMIFLSTIFSTLFCVVTYINV